MENQCANYDPVERENIEALAYLHGIEAAIESLSRPPEATRQLLIDFCEGYYVDDPVAYRHGLEAAIISLSRHTGATLKLLCDLYAAYAEVERTEQKFMRRA